MSASYKNTVGNISLTEALTLAKDNKLKRRDLSHGSYQIESGHPHVKIDVSDSDTPDNLSKLTRIFFLDLENAKATIQTFFPLIDIDPIEAARIINLCFTHRTLILVSIKPQAEWFMKFWNNASSEDFVGLLL